MESITIKLSELGLKDGFVNDEVSIDEGMVLLHNGKILLIIS
jgi:hypothetical protein